MQGPSHLALAWESFAEAVLLSRAFLFQVQVTFVEVMFVEAGKPQV